MLNVRFRPIAEICRNIHHSPVLRPVGLIAFLVLGACGSRQQADTDPLLDGIESELKMPQGTLPLNEYARYYTEDNGRIVGFFYAGDQGEVDLKQFCKVEKFKEFPCGLHAGEILLVPRGHRQWVPSVDHLPMVHGGGCGAVYIEYELANQKFHWVECNGPN